MKQMSIVADVATGIGLPLRVKDLVDYVSTVWHHIQYISHNPKQKDKLSERIRILKGILTSLEREPDDELANIIRENLQSVDELVKSVPISGPSTWVMSSEYHGRLEKAGEKLEKLITQCTAFHNRHPRVLNQTVDLPPCEVGLRRSEHVFKFLTASEISKQPLRVIVIYGQAGIGKTTLLNKVWKDALDSSKHPFRARAYVQVGDHPTPEDITKLQSDIYQQLGNPSAKFPTDNFGSGALGELFRELKRDEKPVFLAIDNVFQVEHLMSLLPSKLTKEDMPSSTCIAITCRDRRIGDAMLSICRLGEDKDSQLLTFEPPYLNSEESKELFAECAGILHSDPAYRGLLCDLVPLCGGLPLALKVLGSIFINERQREPKRWRCILSQWATFDDSGNQHTSVVTKALRLSYDLLHPSRQQAFLDIVSSFYGWHWELVEGIVGEEVMKDLGESSLISKVEDQSQCSKSSLRRGSGEMKNELRKIPGYVWVHDLTLRFGESINNDEVNRLGYADGYQQHQLGYVEHPFTGIGDLPKVTNLRNLILRIRSATSSEQLSALLSTLQHATRLQTFIVSQETGNGPSTIEYRLTSSMDRHYLRYFSHTGQWGEAWSKFLKKVSLEIRFISLCNSNITELLPGSTLPRLEMLHVFDCQALQEIGRMPSLKSLKLQRCKGLTELAESVACMDSLEVLWLENCDSLVELPPDIGKLCSLKYLMLKGSKSVTKLAESVECMESLEELWLADCDSLVELPADIGKVRSLKKLCLERCGSLRKLPESVGLMVSLEELEVSGCHSLVELPADIGNLRSLKELHVIRCKGLTELPESVGSMESLEMLSVDCNSLVELPSSIGTMRSLKSLHLRCESVRKLPESVGCMESLQELKITAFHNPVELPADLGKLSSLTSLYVIECRSLTKLSESVECMKSLEKLWVEDCRSLVELPADIGKVLSLKHLVLHKCDRLTKLPESLESMESLEKLTVGDCDSLVELPADIGKLRSLKVLEIRGSKSLANLPESVACMVSLEELYLRFCNRLAELPADIGKLSSLKELRLKGCGRLRKLAESVESMVSLEKLSVEDCDSLVELPADIGKLRSLRILYLDRCKSLAKLPESVECMQSLEELQLSDCCSLLELPAGIGKLRSLKRWSLEQCSSLTKLPESVGGMESLMRLSVEDCDSLLEMPEDIGKLRSLKLLQLQGCKSLTKMTGSIGCMESLEGLWLEGCNSLVQLPPDIGKLRSLKTLYMVRCGSLMKLAESVGGMENLKTLWVRDCESLVELAPDIRKLRSLEILRLEKCKSLTKLAESVGRMENLEIVCVRDCDSLVELPADIGEVCSLKSLHLERCKSLRTLPESVNSIRYLCVKECSNLTDIQTPEEDYDPQYRAFLIPFSLRMIC